MIRLNYHPINSLLQNIVYFYSYFIRFCTKCHFWRIHIVRYNIINILIKHPIYFAPKSMQKYVPEIDLTNHIFSFILMFNYHFLPKICQTSWNSNIGQTFKFEPELFLARNDHNKRDSSDIKIHIFWFCNIIWFIYVKVLLPLSYLYL